jgi:hypothetical protein
MLEAPTEITEVEVRGKKITLDPKNMRFDENNIGEYMNKEHGWVDFFGKQLEHVKKDILDSEVEEEKYHAEAYISAKDSGNTDNYAKFSANKDQNFITQRKETNRLKEIAGLIEQHLKAWSKNHENVQNRSHTIRQEMKVLNGGTYYEDSDLKDIFQ